MEFLDPDELARLREIDAELTIAKRTVGNLQAERARIRRREAARRDARNASLGTHA